MTGVKVQAQGDRVTSKRTLIKPPVKMHVYLSERAICQNVPEKCFIKKKIKIKKKPTKKWQTGASIFCQDLKTVAFPVPLFQP